MPSTTHRRTYIDKEAVKAALSFAQHLVPRYGLEVIRGEQVRCLFHGQDARPSATIKGDFFHCFTCGAKHDPVGFIMVIERCSFPDALKTAAALVGIQPTASQTDLSKVLAKRSHHTSEMCRITKASNAKYNILCRIARLYRGKNPVWMRKLDYLLNEWLYAVPLWANMFSLVWAFDKSSELEKALTRLCEEHVFRGGDHA